MLHDIEGTRENTQIIIITIRVPFLSSCKEGFNGWHIAKYLK